MPPGCLGIVCALIFVGFILREFAIFTFLNSWLLGTVVFKYLRKYGVSPYTVIVYGSCRDTFEDVIISNGELHPRISHLQGGLDAFHSRKAWLRKKQHRRSIRCCDEERH